MPRTRRSASTTLHRLLLTSIPFATAILASCAAEDGPQDVTITGVDYAFAAPADVLPGRSVVTLVNAGTVDHEMALARLKPGIGLADVTAAMDSHQDPSDLLEEEIGVLFAAPGEASAGSLLVNLVSGATYVALCFLQDDPESPPHSTLGMVTSFEVS